MFPSIRRIRDVEFTISRNDTKLRV